MCIRSREDKHGGQTHTRTQMWVDEMGCVLIGRTAKTQHRRPKVVRQREDKRHQIFA